jgi:hypothetical protein
MQLGLCRPNDASLTGSADNFLDRDPSPGQLKNRRVGVFPPEIALVLEPFRGGEQFRVYCCRTDRAAALPHGFAHSIKESTAGVFHQVPPIGDLSCLRQRFGDGQAVTAAVVERKLRRRQLTADG